MVFHDGRAKSPPRGQHLHVLLLLCFASHLYRVEKKRITCGYDVRTSQLTTMQLWRLALAAETSIDKRVISSYRCGYADYTIQKRAAKWSRSWPPEPLRKYYSISESRNSSPLGPFSGKSLSRVFRTQGRLPRSRCAPHAQYSKVVLSRVLLMAYSSILLEYVLDSTYS